MLEASKKSMEAQAKNYEAQETRFRAGLVSTHDILNHQERLALAELSYIRSIVEYNVKLIELAKAKGVTLIEDNIRVE
jgi:outer membrane protein TolC